MSRIVRINDLSAEEIRIFHALNENQVKRIYEPELGLFIAESPKVIVRALDAGYEPALALFEEGLISEANQDLLGRLDGITVYEASREVLLGITGYNLTSGALCAFRRKLQLGIQEVCDNAKRIVVLENVENPTNMGAIFRSAAALNIDAVILSGDCTDPLYRRAIRVSMGNVFLIPWTYYGEKTDSWYAAGMKELSEMGYTTVAMALSDDSVRLDDKRLCGHDKMAIIMGTEGEGLRKSTIEASDYVVRIPMSHEVDSLNVAAASAVAFWQLAAKND